MHRFVRGNSTKTMRGMDMKWMGVGNEPSWDDEQQPTWK